MRALAWDDMATDADVVFYQELEHSLANEGVALTTTRSIKEFFVRFKEGHYDFAVIDCFEGPNLIGPEHADALRKLTSNQLGDWKDPDFPIFLISTEPDKLDLKHWDQIGAKLLKKNEVVPDQVTLNILGELERVGRRIEEGALFLIRCEAEGTETGSSPNVDVNMLIAWAEAQEMKISSFLFGSSMTEDALNQVGRRILCAEKVVAILTNDERLKTEAGGSEIYHARPNVYMELGFLAFALKGALLKKSLVCVQEGTIFPTDLAGRMPMMFSKSLKEKEREIKAFLEDRRHRDSKPTGLPEK